MKTLETKEWVAIVVALFVIGFFFVFGPSLLSIFTPNEAATKSMPTVTTEDKVLGTGDIAESGTRVTVHYVGHFTDGKVFDSSVARGEPLQFILGRGQVIPGWDQGITGMKVGGTRVLTIPPELGYGPNDYGPIPGNSTLIFEVQLLKVEKI
jgi:FKBP-type peptidyl-prolyl cis-trans isomerase FkpA